MKLISSVEIHLVIYPQDFYHDCMWSFNIPEFVAGKVKSNGSNMLKTIGSASKNVTFELNDGIIIPKSYFIYLPVTEGSVGEERKLHLKQFFLK